jgi:hypothetical protein
MSESTLSGSESVIIEGRSEKIGQVFMIGDRDINLDLGVVGRDKHHLKKRSSIIEVQGRNDKAELQRARHKVVAQSYKL